MKRFAALALLLSALSPAVAQAPTRIQLAQLQTMFTNMRAQTSWNVDGPLRWGYFFFDPRAVKLKQAASELQAQGYETVELQAVPGKDLFRLHVEKIEVHSPVSLHHRNAEFYALADKHGIALYDGMDVGPVEKK